MAYITPSNTSFLSIHALHQNSTSSFRTFWTHEQDAPETSFHSIVLHPSEPHSSPGTLLISIFLAHFPAGPLSVLPEHLGKHSSQLPELTHIFPSTKAFTSYNNWNYFIYTVPKLYNLNCVPPQLPVSGDKAAALNDMVNCSQFIEHITSAGKFKYYGENQPFLQPKHCANSSVESHILWQ